MRGNFSYLVFFNAESELGFYNLFAFKTFSSPFNNCLFILFLWNFFMNNFIFSVIE